MVDLNKAMYNILMGGMILSTATYVVGLFLFFLQNQNPLQATIAHYQSLTEFTRELAELRSAAVLTLATVFLIATPIVRVFVSVLAFAANRNLKYVAVTGIVFLILVTSMALGYFWHFTPQ